jgi:hypothetical protein
MSNPNPPPHDSVTDCTERKPREPERDRLDQKSTSQGYLPALAQDYDRLTLEQWIDLCA